MFRVKNIILTASLGLMPLLSLAQTRLLIPDTLSGTSISLNLQNGTHQFLAGKKTNTMGANGNILGPTLILNNGDFVNFSVKNQLSDTTTIHWHGLHVSSENDGGPHTYILPSAKWSPSFTILDKAATYWYHPHLHHKTNEHVSKGLAGMIIVRDTLESKLTLPRTYGVDDIPLVIQTKDFNANNEVVVHSNLDDVVMVNATTNAYYEVPAQVIRLRILNGSSQRAFNLGLGDNKAFYQIASDGGLLSVPFQTTRVLLAPGERAEILVDFKEMSGQSVKLKSYASELPNGIYGATNPGMGRGMSLTGYSPNPLNGADFDVLRLDVKPQNSNPISTIPTKLVTLTPWDINSSKTTRNLTFTPQTMGMNQLNGKFLINGVSFDMSKVNYTIPLNNIEIWELTNQSGIAHPFHIHDVQFNILTRGGVAPKANEKGWKDVVLVQPMETVRFITKFEDFANDSVPYMYHCHLLRHEDDGMMGQFVVVDSQNTVSINPELKESSITIYPNPSNGVVNIEVKDGSTIEVIKVFNILGQSLESAKINKNVAEIILPKTNGIYTVLVRMDNQYYSEKVVVR